MGHVRSKKKKTTRKQYFYHQSRLDLQSNLVVKMSLLSGSITIIQSVRNTGLAGETLNTKAKAEKRIIIEQNSTVKYSTNCNITKELQQTTC